MEHNYYRRAKRFKLDEDLEVVDEFSPGKRAHGQPRWRDNGMHNKLGKTHKRWFRSQVGKRWETVFSDFCTAAKQAGEYGEHWLHERVEWAVELHVTMIDGYPHERTLGRRHYAQEFRPLWKGDLYVHPETKVLSVAEGLKQAPKPAPPKQEVEVGEVLFTWKQDRWDRKPNHRVTFKLRNIAYNRKVACGVTEEVVDKVWFKHVPYLHSYVDRYGKYAGRDDMGCAIYEEVTRYEVRYTITTASKQEIKQHKLNENS